MLEAEPVWQGDQLMLEAAIRFQPSAEMGEALARGVDLALKVEIRARQRFGPLYLTVQRHDHPITMSFLPLTEQWQISIDGETEQFPRDWLMLEALNETRSWSTGLEKADLQRGQWQLRARARVDLDSLPPAMLLPALLSTQWRLNSRNYTWQLPWQLQDS